MKTVAFHNLGCKVNTYEMEVMQQKFENAGYIIVPFDEKADIYVVNTCTVTNIADRKSRQMLHRAKKMNEDGIVVATGCYAQTDTAGATKDEAIDIVIGNNHKAEIVQIVEAYAKDMVKLTKVDNLSVPVEYEESSIDHSDSRTRVDIKIQDGCNQFCSYCIIPFARGRVRSRDMESIVEEITKLAKEGFKEVVLTGIHLSSYGLDFHPEADGGVPSYNMVAGEGDFTNRDLIEVINKVSAIPGIERIRLGSLEPRVITDEFLAAISSNAKVCPHFHLSMQSGCDSTLKRMNRRYTTSEFYDRVQLLRKYFDNPAITTDIITGFPGEDEEEFAQTVEFVKKVDFYETHLFKYSKRKGTVAEKLPNQNTEAVKAARSNVLQMICDENKHAYMESYIGKETTILIEEEKVIDGVSYLIGHTPNYIRVVTDRKDVEINEIISGKLDGFVTSDILHISRHPAGVLNKRA